MDFCKIGNGWDAIIEPERDKPYFKQLQENVIREYAERTAYPPFSNIFSALQRVDYDDVKVIILGQDPYHGPNQANGLAFAVNDGIPFPPSLVNIFKEIEDDFGTAPEKSGTLVGWAKQGVLLLNATLSVRAHTPMSHSGFGWNQFTDFIFSALLRRKKPLVALLWGSSAGEKKRLVGPPHLALCAPHPSPLSAYRGFFGCRHFTKANEFLSANGSAPIDWANVSGCEPGSYYSATGSITLV